MKITGIILVILGTIIVFINLMIDLTSLGKADEGFIPNDPAEKIAFYIGYNLFIIIGTLLIFFGVRLRKKAIKRAEKKKLVDNLFKKDTTESQ